MNSKRLIMQLVHFAIFMQGQISGMAPRIVQQRCIKGKARMVKIYMNFLHLILVINFIPIKLLMLLCIIRPQYSCMYAKSGMLLCMYSRPLNMHGDNCPKVTHPDETFLNDHKEKWGHDLYKIFASEDNYYQCSHDNIVTC